MKHLFAFIFIITSFTTGAAEDSHQNALQNLIDGSDITHTAIQSGGWFDTTTWAGNQIPGPDAWVLIPEGIQVIYDQISETELAAIRVDGHLQFSPSENSQLIIETLLVEPTGQLTIGTANNPIQAEVEIDIKIRDTGELNVIKDPKLMARGLVASGAVTIHGAKKTPHMKVASDPLLGHNQLLLADAPVNWSVGDILIVAGTRYSGWKWDNDIQAVRYHGTQDEIVTIASINNNIITLNETLAYDHVTPRADLKTSVANMSRNITIATQDPANTATHRRGHVMFMLNAPVDVRYASFWQLGRTDKSFLSLEAVDFDPIQADSNVRGRYAFHLHRKGALSGSPAAVAIGNAVMGSPGWGYVHHDSHAHFHNNVSYDTFGAGFVAESGNEIGSWTHNLAIKAEGNSAFNPKNGNETELFDMGRTGDGFWFQGRMVRSVGNIAASVNHGFVYLHRGSGMLSFPGSAFMLPEALPRGSNTSPDDAPIMSFLDNESFASTVGLYVVKANPNQQHDIHSHFKNFTAWEVRAGSAMEYTAHYLLENFDIIGNTPEPFRSPAFGIEFGTNTSDMVINNARIENMDTGVILSKDYTDPTPPEANQYVLIDVTYNNVNQNMLDYDPTIDQILTGSDLTTGQFDIDINNGIYEYLSPSTTAGSGLSWNGVKTDAIGDIPLPSGTDYIGVPVMDMINTLEQDGYLMTNNGTPYAIVEEYFTDRGSGTIHKLGLKTLLGPDVEAILGNEFHAWADAWNAGTINLNSVMPITADDNYQVTTARPTILNPLANDTDPDGDAIYLDGMTQPSHGTVTTNSDGTISYKSDYDYEGSDYFRYWTTDGHGNFSPADVHINVFNDLIWANNFAH